MANVIKPKRSSVANNVPTTSNLAAGEMGVNMADQKIYINDSTNIVQIGSGKLSGLWDVSLSSLANGQVLQYNSTTGKWNNSSAGTGTVTSITAGTGLTGGTITGSGTIAVSYGTTAGTSCQGNDSRLSDSRSASDVYAWAKASTKPTYTYSEVGAPSTTGTNASGTWGINISGSAASSTIHNVTDSRNTATTPQSINQGVVFDFKANSTDGLSDGGTYFGEMTFRQYGSSTDWTGGLSHQIGFTDNGNVWQRAGSGTTWGAWKKFLDSSNYNSYSPTLTGTGASGTWGINITGSSASCTGNAATATNATNADTLDGNHASAFLTSVPAASQTVLGGVKMYLSGTTLIITTS